MSVRRLILLGVLLWLALAPAAAFAHKVPPEVVAFFKVDGGRLRVVVRVPTAMLLDARMPMVQTTFLDVPNLPPSLRSIGAEVIRSLDVTDGGRPAAASVPTFILTPFGDRAGARAFASFETAMQRFGSSPALPPAAADGEPSVYWNEAWVDYQFDYATAAREPHVAARLNGLRTGGDFFQTRATFIAADGDVRTLTVTGPPQRVLFEPSTDEALSAVLRRSIDLLAGERLLWLFILCLAIPARRAAIPATPFLAFATAQLVTLAIVAMRSSQSAAVSEAMVDTMQFVAAGALVLAAVQALLDSGLLATSLAAAAFGGALGVVLGSRLHDVMPLAGSHAGVVLAAFGLLSTAALGLLLAVLASLVRLADRVQAPAWLVTAVLCAVPAHEAAHQLVDAAARLGAIERWLLPTPLALLVTHWPLLAVAVFVALLWMLAATGRLRPLTGDR